MFPSLVSGARVPAYNSNKWVIIRPQELNNDPFIWIRNATEQRRTEKHRPIFRNPTPRHPPLTIPQRTESETRRRDPTLNLNTTGHQDRNKAKSSNVPLYLKKIKMSFNHPPRPNKVLHLQSVHSLLGIDVYCSRRKGWCCLYKEKSLSRWVLLTHS